jgi:hypothetical protein
LEGDKMAKTKRRWEDKKEGVIRKMNKQEE